MNYAEFRQATRISEQDLCLNAFAENRSKIRVKKEKTAVKNLSRILEAALKISNEKGFRAMTMRDFSKETGLSMGALYSYFTSKEELLETIQRQGRRWVKRILNEQVMTADNPRVRLRRAMRIHIYLSEVLQPWFYFSFMEAKNMDKPEKDKAMASELSTDQLFADIIRQGRSAGVFGSRDPQLTAGIIKAMLQDWYLKRWKYRKRKISVDQYADFVLDCVEAILLPAPGPG